MDNFFDIGPYLKSFELTWEDPIPPDFILSFCELKCLLKNLDVYQCFPVIIVEFQINFFLISRHYKIITNNIE